MNFLYFLFSKISLSIFSQFSKSSISSSLSDGLGERAEVFFSGGEVLIYWVGVSDFGFKNIRTIANTVLTIGMKANISSAVFNLK